MYVLRANELHWVQYQISLVLEIGYNTKSIVWLRMKLLVGIQQSRQCQFHVWMLC